MIFKCPGQDKRNIEAQAIVCAWCGYEAEIFSDEFSVACPRCRNRVGRETKPSCVQWCSFAKACTGFGSTK